MTRPTRDEQIAAVLAAWPPDLGYPLRLAALAVDAVARLNSAAPVAR